MQIVYVKQVTVFNIDDFGISEAILHGGANSGQTSIKCRDLACGVRTIAVGKLQGFNHEIWSQISFPNFIFRRLLF